MKTLMLFGIVAAAFALGACGEKEQTAQGGERKVSSEPWSGASTAYTAPGWKAGDQASWEAQIKSRARAQNEYARTSGAN